MAPITRKKNKKQRNTKSTKKKREQRENNRDDQCKDDDPNCDCYLRRGTFLPPGVEPITTTSNRVGLDGSRSTNKDNCMMPNDKS
mmetsp:Transcript_21246/g.31564  ORF Transcript_21246/g.31564 Transcript_21246/m.31564 type:complete len:85 (-) Transcript_21246:14-268(-)